MAERTLNPHRLKALAVFFEEPGHADYGIGFEQCQGVCWVIEVDPTAFDPRRDFLGDCIHVDF
jgi:hypothetical protein